MVDAYNTDKSDLMIHCFGFRLQVYPCLSSEIRPTGTGVFQGCILYKVSESFLPNPTFWFTFLNHGYSSLDNLPNSLKRIFPPLSIFFLSLFIILLNRLNFPILSPELDVLPHYISFLQLLPDL